MASLESFSQESLIAELIKRINPQPNPPPQPPTPKRGQVWVRKDRVGESTPWVIHNYKNDIDCMKKGHRVIINGYGFEVGGPKFTHFASVFNICPNNIATAINGHRISDGISYEAKMEDFQKYMELSKEPYIKPSSIEECLKRGTQLPEWAPDNMTLTKLLGRPPTSIETRLLEAEQTKVIPVEDNEIFQLTTTEPHPDDRHVIFRKKLPPGALVTIDKFTSELVSHEASGDGTGAKRIKKEFYDNPYMTHERVRDVREALGIMEEYEFIDEYQGRLNKRWRIEEMSSVLCHWGYCSRLDAERGLNNWLKNWNIEVKNKKIYPVMEYKEFLCDGEMLKKNINAIILPDGTVLNIRIQVRNKRLLENTILETKRVSKKPKKFTPNFKKPSASSYY